jgi:hypothetical protein
MVKRYATLDEMYYPSTKARPTLNLPSAWLRLDWFVSADADCNECLQNMTSGKMPKNLGHIEPLARSYTDS